MVRKGIFVLAMAAIGVYISPMLSTTFDLWGYGFNLILQIIGAGVFGTVGYMVATRRPI